MTTIKMVCLYFGVLLALSASAVRAHMNLYLNQFEVMRLLGLSAELYYVRDGQVNEYALHFMVPVPANVKDIAFTWQSLAGRPLPYTINIITSDPDVLPRPVMNISASGSVPTDIETFAIALRCSGLRAAEVEVTIAIEVTLNRAALNTTELVFRRKKICLESDHRENVIDDPLLLETVIAPPNGLITLVIGVILAAILVAVIISVAYCARSGPTAKRNGHHHLHHHLHDGQPLRTSSFQRLPTCHQSSGPPSLVFPPAPTSTLPRQPHHNNGHAIYAGTESEYMHGPIDTIDYGSGVQTLQMPSGSVAPGGDQSGGDDEQLLQRRIHEVTVQSCRVGLFVKLQEGTFGRVYRGTYNECQPVLVKTVKENASQSQVSVLLREGMSLWGVSHPGIQSILGVSVEDHVPPYLLFAAPHGTRNLKLFLQEPSARSLTTIQIVQMATQLALALEHLHQHGLVHRDIAARNCVIDDGLHVRLTDCALARDLFPGDYSCLGDRENRPVKWLALEALTDKRFGEASDAWSFGVLMWELCTLARQPYQEIVDDEMEQFLRDGYRLAQPVNCPDELFAIMAYCWALSPLERPTFGQLQVCLEGFHAQITKYV